MPKLIIPNAYEIYQLNDRSLTAQEINGRYFYNLRFLWLLDPGDIIILPKLPTNGFLSYLANLKQISSETLHIIILDEQYPSLETSALSDTYLLAQLAEIITDPSVWYIQSCYFNSAVAALAERLCIPMDTEKKQLAESNFIRHINSKIAFRKMANDYHIPIPEGTVCFTSDDLAEKLSALLRVTGQVIIKQEFNAAGKGNIGISNDEEKNFVGVIKTIYIKNKESIREAVTQLWNTHINSLNHGFIVEVYYPNKGSVTAQFWVPPRGQAPTLVNCSEIRMEERWVGVCIPPHKLSAKQRSALINYSNQFSLIVQARGYEGYICCDAIIMDDEDILFTEINVRPGAETHAYILAEHFFGVNEVTILTCCVASTHAFVAIYQMLEKEKLLLNDQNPYGIILLTVDDIYLKQLEYLIAAPDLASAYTLEARMKKLLEDCKEYDEG